MIHAQELLDGYDILFDSNTRLAHEAVLLWASENEPDGWPTPASVHRFARCYGVDLDTLAGLCGILAVKRGNSHYYCDSRRHPDLVNRLSPTRFSRRGLVAFGFYNTASAMAQGAGRRAQARRSTDDTPPGASRAALVVSGGEDGDPIPPVIFYDQPAFEQPVGADDGILDQAQRPVKLHREVAGTVIERETPVLKVDQYGCRVEGPARGVEDRERFVKII